VLSSGVQVQDRRWLVLGPGRQVRRPGSTSPLQSLPAFHEFEEQNNFVTLGKRESHLNFPKIHNVGAVWSEY
jgi:hypothetical protein